MRLQAVGTVESVVPKRDDLADARNGKLTNRLQELEAATRQGYVLTHTAVLEGEHYAAFVDTLTQDRSL
ncbi:hypothetical protein NY551_18300 [Curtobacterium flaccumfaciens pv. oortii]|uniref:hypothetical protein n=1 Tax=Curtobacterium flaccumfaciens TaxID=2035 RepID=UPI002657B2D9|nr:hypothetical protein [Curtobacterium flaccumfaciens]MCS5524689.1 hypothetical protein [Curtobacterium flaccumfaciens pv. oortii]